MTNKMVLISYNHPFLRFPKKQIVNILKLVLKTEKRKKNSLAIIFTNNYHIKKINKEFLNHNYTTDVIAFSLGKDCGIDAEIYINLDAARKQAKEYMVSYSNEVSRLIIHGLLHIIGYNDATSDEKKKIIKLENKYLTKIFRKVG